MISSVNESTFENDIKNGSCVVDFYADWCGPCKMLAPVIEEVAKERTNLNIYKVNVDETGELSLKYKVRSIPTLVFFKDGVEVTRHVGYISKIPLLKKVDELL